MRILLIEDDKKLCETLKYQLERESFPTDFCHDGEEGLALLLTGRYDLALLDRMLPSMDGLSILRRVRREGLSMPIILLTALGGLEDRVTGLNLGADDYIVKPFAFSELMARIRCVIRRPRDIFESEILSFSDLRYDVQQHILSCGNQSCTLSKREGELMELFLRNPQQTLPRQTILLRVWGLDIAVEDGNLDNYIYFIRRRLNAVGSRTRLTTARGVGYRLEESHV